MSVKDLTDVILEFISKATHQVINLDEVSKILKEELKDEYTSEVSIEVKNRLKSHPDLDFFREGDYINDNKFYFCAGNWLAKKDLYSNGVQAKNKIGLLSWQRFEGEEDLD